MRRRRWENCGCNSGQVTRVSNILVWLWTKPTPWPTFSRSSSKLKSPSLKINVFRETHSKHSGQKDQKIHENEYWLDGYKSQQYQQGRNGCFACQVVDSGRSQDGGRWTKRMRTYLDIFGPKFSLMAFKNTVLSSKCRQQDLSLGRGNRCLQQRMFMKKTSGIGNHVQHPVRDVWAANVRLTTPSQYNH